MGTVRGHIVDVDASNGQFRLENPQRDMRMSSDLVGHVDTSNLEFWLTDHDFTVKEAR